MGKCQVVEGPECYTKGCELYPEAMEGFREEVAQPMCISGQSHQWKYEEDLAGWCHVNSRLELPAFLALHSQLNMFWSFLSTTLLPPQQGGLESDSGKSGTFWVVKVKSEKPFLTKSKVEMLLGFLEANAEGWEPFRYSVKPELRLWVAIHFPSALLHPSGCWLELSDCTTVGFANLSS